MKADEKVEYEKGTKMNYTNFEELQTKVEVLQETIDEITEILRDNNIQRIKKIKSPYFDEDEVYRRLEEK